MGLGHVSPSPVQYGSPRCYPPMRPPSSLDPILFVASLSEVSHIISPESRLSRRQSENGAPKMIQLEDDGEYRRQGP